MQGVTGGLEEVDRGVDKGKPVRIADFSRKYPKNAQILPPRPPSRRKTAPAYQPTPNPPPQKLLATPQKILWTIPPPTTTPGNWRPRRSTSVGQMRYAGVVVASGTTLGMRTTARCAWRRRVQRESGAELESKFIFLLIHLSGSSPLQKGGVRKKIFFEQRRGLPR